MASVTPLAAQSFTNLYSFTTKDTLTGTNGDGANPLAAVILSGNRLYGTTEFAGTNNYGTVFGVNADGSGFTNLYSFGGGSDGANPVAALVLSGNRLYGTTENGGGPNDSGTVFAINTDGTGYASLYSFSGSDGANPVAGLALSGTTLYGTVKYGGANGNGAVFALNTDGTGFTNLYSFTGGNDGAIPVAGLVLSGNRLYGTAEDGGTNGYGAVFALNTDGSGFTNLYSFTDGNDGASPAAGLILSGSKLYGVAQYGGPSGNGTVFALNTDGSGFANLYSFAGGSDGANPQAALTLAGSKLCGVAQYGGPAGNGTVFAINVSGGGFTNLHSFTVSPNSYTNSDGIYPSGLILSGTLLYGTAGYGGTKGSGTVFALSPSNLPPVALFAANTTNGVAPLTVTFTNLSSLATNYAWAFGDNSSSTLTNVTHTYTNAGTYSVTLTAIGPGGTNKLTRTNYIVAVMVAAGGNQTLCCGSATAGLGGTVGGGATGGIWSSSGTGTFSPNTATLNATYQPAAADCSAGTVTLTLTTTGGTNGVAATNVVVTIRAPATVGVGGSQTICSSGAASGLGGSMGGGATGGVWSSSGTGTFTPNATTLNATYTPSPADAANGSVSLLLTTTGQQPPCGAATEQMVVSIRTAATVAVGGSQTICSSGTTSGLGGMVGGGATGGTWSSPTGGTFSPNATTLNASYTPSASDISAGTVTVTLTTTGQQSPCGAVTAAVPVTVRKAATAAVGASQTICSSGVTAGLGGTVGGGATGGLWWSPTGGAFSPNATALNATYTPSTADASNGSVTLLLTTTGQPSPCGPATAQVVVTVPKAATVAVGGSQTICSSGSTSGLGGTVGGGATGGTWSSSTGGAFAPNTTTLNASYTPSASDISAGTVTLTLTTTGQTSPCGAVTATVVVTVNKAAAVSVGGAQTVCSSSATAGLGGTVGGGATGGTWSTTTGGTFSPSATALNATYTPSTADAVNGSVTLLLTTTGQQSPCGAATAQVVVTVRKAATVAVGGSQTICSSGATSGLGGTVGGGATGGTWSTTTGGTFAPSTATLNASYTPSASDISAGAVTLTLTTTGQQSPCGAATAQLVVTIRAAATVAVGSSQTICSSGVTAGLGGTVGGGATGGTWGSSGTGTFSPSATALNATYTPSAGDSVAGTVTLTLSSTGQQTPCGPANAQMIVTLYSAALGTTARLEGPGSGSDSVVLAVPTPTTAWTATANAAWLHLSPANQSGMGSTNVIFSYDANLGATRSGTLTVGCQTLNVTQAGSFYVAAPGPLTTLVSAGLNTPTDVAVDGTGNVFIADYGTNAVEEWRVTNNSLTVLASAGLNSPLGVAVDGAGNVYISDYGNNAIKEWTATNNSITTLVAAGLNQPGGIAVDSAGNVYISDSGNNVIKKWTATNNSITTLVASGLSQPAGIALDAAGNVYIADAGNIAIKEWIAANNTLATLVATGLNSPWGVAVDGAGNVYVADSGINAILKWPVTNNTLTTVVSAGLNSPVGVAVDGAGNLYIADTGNGFIEELPRAFVDPTPKSETAGAGSDVLPVVLPSTVNLRAPFAPTSDQAWLTITGITNGVVGFAFTANTGSTPRTGHITLLGQPVAITQLAALTPPILFGPKLLGNGSFQFAFSNNASGATFTVLTTSNLSLPLTNWTVAGLATNIAPGLFQFSTAATNNPRGYYRVRSP